MDHYPTIINYFKLLYPEMVSFVDKFSGWISAYGLPEKENNSC